MTDGDDRGGDVANPADPIADALRADGGSGGAARMTPEEVAVLVRAVLAGGPGAAPRASSSAEGVAGKIGARASRRVASPGGVPRDRSVSIRSDPIRSEGGVTAMSDPAPAPAPTCIGGVYRLLDEETGETIEVPVSVDIATALRSLDEGLARRERSRIRHERSLSAMAGRAGDGDGDAEYEYDMVDPRTVAPAHDGPRLSFTLLVGIGVRWDGPDPKQPRCPCCHDASLAANAYCLRCDRSGRDDLLKPLAPSPAACPRRVPPPVREGPGVAAGPAATGPSEGTSRGAKVKAKAKAKSAGAGWSSELATWRKSAGR